MSAQEQQSPAELKAEVKALKEDLASVMEEMAKMNEMMRAFVPTVMHALKNNNMNNNNGSLNGGAEGDGDRGRERGRRQEPQQGLGEQRRREEVAGPREPPLVAERPNLSQRGPLSSKVFNDPKRVARFSSLDPTGKIEALGHSPADQVLKKNLRSRSRFLPLITVLCLALLWFFVVYPYAIEQVRLAVPPTRR